MSENNELRDYPDDQAVLYKPIHGLSIVALLVAIASLLVIAFPPLIILNMIAAVLAIFSIRHLTKSERFVGLTTAKIALFLAVVSAVFSTTHVLGRAWYLNRTARKHTLVIANLIMEGRYGEAYEYSIDPQLRKPEGTDLAAYYNINVSSKPTVPPPSMEIKIWQAVPPLEIIEKDNRRGKLRFIGYDQYKKLNDPFWEPLACVYKYEPASPDLDATTFQMVMLRRRNTAAKNTNWRLYLFDILAGPRAEKKQITIGGPAPEGEADESNGKGN